MPDRRNAAECVPYRTTAGLLPETSVNWTMLILETAAWVLIHGIRIVHRPICIASPRLNHRSTTIRQSSCWQPYAGINWGYVVLTGTTEGFDRQFPSVEPPSMPETEADTCRRFVLPKLYAAGWNDDQINEQYTFTDGRVIPNPRRIRRGRQKRAQDGLSATMTLYSDHHLQ